MFGIGIGDTGCEVLFMVILAVMVHVMIILVLKDPEPSRFVLIPTCNGGDIADPEPSRFVLIPTCNGGDVADPELSRFVLIPTWYM